MSWLRTSLREIFGLFVDDGKFASLILLWIGFAAWLLPRLTHTPPNGLLLFAGLAALLAGSCLRYTRRKRQG